MAILPFKRVMCANRGEIAVRVFRASTELGFRTVAIFSEEDRVHLHRYKADEAYLVGKGLEPVAAYLAEDEIVELAKRHEVDAIHPGYGLLSERASFARKCRDAGIVFIGPTPEAIDALGDKVAARKIAQAAGVPVVPGTPEPVRSVEAARAFCDKVGYPVIIKASAGGGGRGMRVVRNAEDLKENLERAGSEARKAFGDDSLFIEKLVVRPKHIEVQILGDNHGSLVHLYERDCSVQRRHQKVVEYAPAWSLPAELRERIAQDALKIARQVNYTNAGTVEFLVATEGASSGEHYFIEVNPRIQVEHTVTEVITGRDLVQAQILIAQGHKLADPEIDIPDQAAIEQHGVAIQVRITAEDPRNEFLPDTGKIQVYRPAVGLGIRLDDGSGYVGARVSPYYDSLLAKVTANGLGWDYARRKAIRALREFRIRGVKTNLAFLENVLSHPTFAEGKAHTTFIDETPALVQYTARRDRATRILRYVASTVVNGHPTVRGKPKPSQHALTTEPLLPPASTSKRAPVPGTKQILDARGPEGVVKWLRSDRRVRFTDTTWRDAHQSLLATRLRTFDLARIAPSTAHLMSNFFSLEMWGGATFDVAYRFLSEDPWVRLEELRKLVPNVMFQMLVRGANAVGYTNYSDDVVVAFIEEAAACGMDVFRIFDALNDVDNMQVAIDAAQKTGKIVETAMCYTGDVSDPRRTKYDLKYYVELAKEIVRRGTHLLCIKDMAGLLKPRAATMLVKALKEAVDVPIHLHMHDTSGNSIASYFAAIDAGIDVVDGAVSSMAGMTSQPSLSSLAFGLAGTPRDPQIDPEAMEQLSVYWEPVRRYYLPFEAGLNAPAADVYEHEIPGGQYSNLKAQAEALGVGEGGWELVKKAYTEVNRLFGDIPKVTPSSKVVGDMAIWMVKQNLDAAAVSARAAELTFPESVIDFMRGSLGQPPGGFPEPLRTHVLKGAKKIEGRPGASMPPFDWAGAKREMEQLAGTEVARRDVVSYALYPKVLREYMEHRALHGDTSVLPTPTFFYGLRVGEEAWIDIEPGKTLIVKLLSVGDLEADGARTLTFEINGQPRSVRVFDDTAKVAGPKRRKATGKPGEVGAPMPGRVIDLVTKVGEHVKAGQKLLVTEAMKLETVVKAPVTGVVREIVSGAGESVEAGDLLVLVEEQAQ
ncbi:MAG TPA: pyruvate carboxylase [Polyangia bacterium]|jgi:pyruvate carboxylase|nr:pyruvate carboxylase [Polyangia bacterium]